MTTETKTPIRITTGAGGGKIYMLFSEPQEQKRIEDFLTEISLGTNTKVSADISTNIDYYPDSHFTPGEPTLITNKYSIRATLFIDQITKIEIKGTSDPRLQYHGLEAQIDHGTDTGSRGLRTVEDREREQKALETIARIAKRYFTR